MTAVLRYRSISPSLGYVHDSWARVAAMEPTSPTTPEHRAARHVFSHCSRPSSRSLHDTTSVSLASSPEPRTHFSNTTQRESPVSDPRRFSYPLDRPSIDLAESSGLLPTQAKQRNSPLRTLSGFNFSARRSTSSGGPPQSVPSPIGTPVSSTNFSFPFGPVIEDDYEDQAIRSINGGRAVSSAPSSLSRSPRIGSSCRPQRARPHARLSIFLTPPLQTSDPNGNLSPPLTPILAVLEEGYNHCVRTVLKQDALVAAVNHTRHLRIDSTRLCYLETEPRSQGAYGDVWYGRLEDKRRGFRTVAIKRIRLRSQDGSSDYGLLKALLQEVMPWYRLDHPNISPFIGYTFDGGHATLVSEWQHHGHVMDYLRKHPNTNRLELIAQAAEALAYLHDRASPLIHGDIKPENVLVSREGLIKLTDFGISTVLHQYPASDLRTSQSFRGTLRYADPTLLDDNPKPTTFTDLWAFGWLIFGMLTERRPYEHIQSEFNVTLAIMKYEVARPSDYPDLPYGELIWPILTASWSQSNSRRWPASCIAGNIRQNMEQSYRPTQVHVSKVGPRN